MCSAELLQDGQLIQIRFAGQVTLADAEECNRQVRGLIPALKPGFCLLTDISELEEMSLACEPLVAELMDVFAEHGIKKVIRVVPKPDRDIGFGIMSLFHYGPAVRVVTCKSMDEAKVHLPS
jgi:hypothetical protein